MFGHSVAVDQTGLLQCSEQLIMRMGCIVARAAGSEHRVSWCPYFWMGAPCGGRGVACVVGNVSLKICGGFTNV